MKVKWNLNEFVEATLTQAGADFLNEHEFYGRRKVWNKGDTLEKQGWSFFDLFKDNLYLGSPVLFNLTITLHNAEEIR